MESHLASMENITCWAFRKLCSGATDSYTGMLSASYLIKRSKAWKEADFFPIDNQRQWLQIATSKEKECAELLFRLQRELSVFPEKNALYGIQLNVSCPSPEFVNLGQGAALIKRPGKIASLIKELLKGKFKVSLKIRLGFHSLEAKEKRILKVLEALQKIGPNFSHVVIHFKYANEPSYTPYDYSLLNEICKFNLPIIINGGITSLDNYKKIISSLPKNNSVKGFMIGREALKNPDCFSSESARTPAEILSEFKSLCEQHPPKDIYIRKISELAPWASLLKEIIKIQNR